MPDYKRLVSMGLWDEVDEAIKRADDEAAYDIARGDAQAAATKRFVRRQRYMDARDLFGADDPIERGAREVVEPEETGDPFNGGLKVERDGD